MANERRTNTALWVLLGGAAFFVFVLGVFTLVYLSLRVDNARALVPFGDRIAVVEIEGVLLNPSETVAQLKKYGDDGSIRAIVLHINTPGGGAAASEEIYRMVKRIREQKKKRVVASIETVGASGGYYIASAADKIFADQASVVGSIGVIAQWFNYAELLRWAKLKDVTFKSAEFKDTGSPTRDLTPAEREYLQTLINDMHKQFVDAVASGRKMKPEDVRTIANGKVWTGSQALGMKLVDEVGDFQAAIDDTARAVGIKGEPILIRPEKDRHTFLDLLFTDIEELMPSKSKLMESHVGFYYLWK